MFKSQNSGSKIQDFLNQDAGLVVVDCADSVSIATIDRAETSPKDQQVILNGVELC